MCLFRFVVCLGDYGQYTEMKLRQPHDFIFFIYLFIYLFFTTFCPFHT